MIALFANTGRLKIPFKISTLTTFPTNRKKTHNIIITPETEFPMAGRIFYSC